MTTLISSDGSRITLGAALGRGGEGSVFAVAGTTSTVAKIYHTPASREKEAKLSAMVAGCDDEIKAIAAWPITTLRSSSQSAVVGFTMPSVVGFQPVHMIYSPAHRKQEYPAADWSFLVHVARNIAAAFSVIHEHGHFVGDVNQANVVVGKDGTVRLIDCDSFQVAAASKEFLCEVGVPHFTPPELQGLQSFRGVRHTQNHDNFGLAMICFHLLFMGRHPYAGVHSRGLDESLEESIAAHRFAYGRDAARYGVARPPNSVGLEIVPNEIAEKFELAFSDRSTQDDRRPSALEWGAALDRLKSSLRTCQSDGSHRFYAGLDACPWCGIQQRAGVTFFVRAITTSHGRLDLQIAWRRIEAVQMPVVVEFPDQSRIQVAARPLPPDVVAARTSAVVRKMFAVVIAVASLAVPPAVLVAWIVAAILFFWPTDDETTKKEREVVDERRRALAEAEGEWHRIKSRWYEEGGNIRFVRKLGELREARNSLQELDTDLVAERRRLMSQIRERQLQRFLETFYVDAANIPDIGSKRKAVLASFGIETAADINGSAVRRIAGFGEKRTGKLLAWRRSCESRFTFVPSKGIDPRDMADLDSKFDLKRRQLESSLETGPGALRTVAASIVAAQFRLRSEVSAAAQRLAQAKADMSLL